MLKKLPQHVPCLPLGDVLLFPKAVISLRVFEPEHKQMITDALRGDRILATLSGYPQALGGHPDTSWSSYAQGSYLTLGMLVACRRSQDSVYDVLIKGLSRVHCHSLLTQSPYPIVEIEKPVSQRKSLNIGLKKLHQELQSLLSIHHKLGGQATQELLLYIKELNDPEAIIDAVASALPEDVTSQTALHQTLDSKKRFQILIQDLHEANAELLLERSLRGQLSRDHIYYN